MQSAVWDLFKDMADRGRLLPADFKYRPDKVSSTESSVYIDVLTVLRTSKCCFAKNMFAKLLEARNI